jgi:hypothetical protein
MAIGATDVITPVLATAEIVSFFLAGVTAQTGLRSLFRRFALEADDL